MGGLFSKKKETPPPNRITEQDKAVLSLKQQRDKLKQYQKKITLNLEKEREVAKQLLKDNKKEKALTLLKKKRYQENLLEKTDNQLEKIDRLVQEVEFKQVEMNVVEGLKNGTDALNKLNQMMSIEDVEKIMEDTREAVEYQEEINEMISGGLTQEDEDDILKELDEITGTLDLPSVPETELVGEADALPDVPTEEPERASKEKTRVAVAAS